VKLVAGLPTSPSSAPRQLEQAFSVQGTCKCGASATGIEAPGSGPDGGRDASFRGRVPYPSSADPWSGFGILQAKFKERILGPRVSSATFQDGQVRPHLCALLVQSPAVAKALARWQERNDSDRRRWR
jgi:hypothetical protein